jgi:TP901 family phage tail tape measure protein
MDIPAPNIPQPTIPAPNTSLFKRGLEEIQAGLDEIAQNNALNTLATQLSIMSMGIGPIQQSLQSMMDQPSVLAKTFESSMKNIQAITGNTHEEMAVLNYRLLEIGKTAVAGPQGVVDAMNDIAGGVDNAASHLGILNGAILLAEAGQADLGVAANGLVSIMNAYRLASGDAASATANAVTVSDVLTQTVGQGVGSMEAFIGAFSQVSGLSASVGVGFDEVGAALAFITTQGPSATEAATQLKAAETALLNPNKTLSEALHAIGIASGSAMLAEYGLVETLNIVNQAVGGSQDAMAKALGSTEALNGATALLGSGYTDFAAKFGTALESSVTAEAAAIQNQSYETKLARMEAATQALQVQIGDNINGIKGFFAELGTGFLTNVVSPIMSSSAGGVFQQMAAGIGVAGQSLLGFAGTGLSTMSMVTTLAANIRNLGGVAQILHGTLDVMQAPLLAMKTGLQNLIAPMIAKITTTYTMTAAESGHAAALWAAAGAGWAAVAPLLPFVAIGVLVISVIKEIASNWGSVTAAFESGGILGAIKQIGALLISGLLAPVQGLLEIVSYIPGLGHLAGQGVDKIQEFRNSLTGVDPVRQPTELKTAAPSIIDPSTLQGDIAGLQSQIGVSLTPQLSPALAIPDIANPGMAVEVPAQPIAPKGVTATASSNGNALAMEHIEAAQRKGVAASDMSYTAASAFEHAGAYTPPLTPATPVIDLQQTTMTAASNPFFESLPIVTTTPHVDIPDIESEARVTFAEAMPARKETAISPRVEREPRPERRERPSFTVQNLYLQSQDIKDMYDLYCQFEMLFADFKEEPV